MTITLSATTDVGYLVAVPGDGEDGIYSIGRNVCKGAGGLNLSPPIAMRQRTPGRSILDRSWGDEVGGPNSGVRLLRKGEHIARKWRSCTDCLERGAIAPGERYRETVVLIDGRFEVNRWCLSIGCLDVPSTTYLPDPYWGQSEMPP